jgi:fructose-specific phosphotransferase system component IIB
LEPYEVDEILVQILVECVERLRVYMIMEQVHIRVLFVPQVQAVDTLPSQVREAQRIILAYEVEVVARQRAVYRKRKYLMKVECVERLRVYMIMEQVHIRVLFVPQVQAVDTLPSQVREAQRIILAYEVEVVARQRAVYRKEIRLIFVQRHILQDEIMVL